MIKNDTHAVRFPSLIILLAISMTIFTACSNQNRYEAYNSISILFAGNSHIRTGNIPGQLQEIARLHGIEITYLDVSRNGVNLNGVMRNNAITKMNIQTFDYVVFQSIGRSLRPTTDLDGFLNDIQSFSEEIRNSGAIPVLYNPAWANINGRPDEELQRILTQAHKRAAYENDLILINAGDAWVYAYRAIPGLSLYARDRIHANHIGAFLTACVFAATLLDLNFESLPSGNAFYDINLLNLFTFIAILSMALCRYAKKDVLNSKKILIWITPFAILQVMSFFPHIFRFVEFGNLILLLNLIACILFILILNSIYHLFIAKKRCSKSRKENKKSHIFVIIICCAACVIILNPFLDFRHYVYAGENAIELARIAWKILN